MPTQMLVYYYTNNLCAQIYKQLWMEIIPQRMNSREQVYNSSAASLAWIILLVDNIVYFLFA